MPAVQGDRITVVCAPSGAPAGGARRRGGLLPPIPPGTQPGEALAVTNHRTGSVSPLLRPPLPGSQSTLPSWLLPAAVVLSGSDAALGFIDPSLPLLAAAGKCPKT